MMKECWGVMALSVCVAAFGQSPVITSFSQNGGLICSNLLPSTLTSVEWASSAMGPWTNNWAGMDSLRADSNGMIRVSVPMFYRVRGVAMATNMVMIPAGSFSMGDTFGEGWGNELPFTQIM